MWLFYFTGFLALVFAEAERKQLIKTFAVTPKDCAEVQWGGQSKSGVYTIYPITETEGVRVYCDLTTDGGGWTVFQRRLDGSEDFYVDWNDYRSGFGRPDLGEYWLGNDNIHWITRRLKHELRIDMVDWSGNKRYAEYERFYIEGAGTQYKLYVSAYSGNAGDSLAVHNGMMFTTKDRDNDLLPDNNCAITCRGAWWYQACHASNLNGLYHNGGTCPYAIGVIWAHWKGQYYSLRRTEMKMRPINFQQASTRMATIQSV